MHDACTIESQLFFFRFVLVNKIDVLVETIKKLTNNFAGLVVNDLGPDVIRGSSVLPR